MNIEQIDSDYKSAFKEKNEIVVSSLRNLKSEIKNVEIAKQKTLTEEEVLQVVAKKVKQHKDSIQSFTAGNRTDLAEHEQKQMAVLQKYLPAQIDETELRNIVKAVITETSATAKDFGKAMKEVMTRVKGRSDGGAVSKLLKEELK